MQPTDLTPQEPEISDLAPREIETASCDSPQGTESPIYTDADMPEALQPHAVGNRPRDEA